MNNSARILLAAVTAIFVAASVRAAESDEAFLDDLQRRSFAFYWETANPTNGLIPDRARAVMRDKGMALPAAIQGAKTIN